MKLGRRGFLGGLIGALGAAAVSKAALVKPVLALDECQHVMLRSWAKPEYACSKCGYTEDARTYGLSPPISNWEWRTCLVSHDGVTWQPKPALEAFQEFVGSGGTYVQGPDELVAEIILRARERKSEGALMHDLRGGRTGLSRVDGNVALERDLASLIDRGSMWLTKDDKLARDLIADKANPGRSFENVRHRLKSWEEQSFLETLDKLAAGEPILTGEPEQSTEDAGLGFLRALERGTRPEQSANSMAWDYTASPPTLNGVPLRRKELDMAQVEDDSCPWYEDVADLGHE